MWNFKLLVLRFAPEVQEPGEGHGEEGGALNLRRFGMFVFPNVHCESVFVRLSTPASRLLKRPHREAELVTQSAFDQSFRPSQPWGRMFLAAQVSLEEVIALRKKELVRAPDRARSGAVDRGAGGVGRREGVGTRHGKGGPNDSVP